MGGLPTRGPGTVALHPAAGSRSSPRGGEEAIFKGLPAAHAAAASKCRPGSASFVHLWGAGAAEARPHPRLLARAEPAAGIALLRRGRRTAELQSGDESAAAKRAAPASASRAPERRAEHKPRARLGERQPAATAGGGRAGWAEPAGQLPRRRETGARQHGAVSACGAPRLARGAAARPHRGANLPGRGPGLRRRGAGGGRSRRHRHNGWPGPTRARP